MFNISPLLEKFKNLGAQEIAGKDEIIKIVGISTGVVISRKDISIRDGIAHIKTSPAAKSAIFVNKAKILTILQSSQGVQKILDIR